MKKTIILGLFVAIATMTTAQVAFTEISYDSLDVTSKQLFSQYGVANPYGEIIKVETDSILGVFEITNIPKSRKMVTDSTGTHPEYATQYMVVYVKDGENKAFVSIDDPRSSGSNNASISALLSSSGLRQGDDEFLETQKETTQREYVLTDEW